MSIKKKIIIGVIIGLVVIALVAFGIFLKNRGQNIGATLATTQAASFWKLSSGTLMPANSAWPVSFGSMTATTGTFTTFVTSYYVSTTEIAKINNLYVGSTASSTSGSDMQVAGANGATTTLWIGNLTGNIGKICLGTASTTVAICAIGNVASSTWTFSATSTY